MTREVKTLLWMLGYSHYFENDKTLIASWRAVREALGYSEGRSIQRKAYEDGWYAAQSE
jgi:hypothetical protein